jgi:peptidoglycan hydrolase FlgJ
MSIFPATDIVSDVARAADPQTAQAAAARLASIAAAKGATGELSPAPFSVTPAARAINAHPESTLLSDTAPRVETLSAAQKFEAFLLQSWLENLLPKESSGACGSDF